MSDIDPKKITLGEFEFLFNNYSGARTFDAIHLHHSVSPNATDYWNDEVESVPASYSHQLATRGWEDVAQHLSIAPDGSLWLGRGWVNCPASAKGHNGSTASGPFMIVLIGNFDEEHLQGKQKQSLLNVVRLLGAKMEVRFPRDFANNGTSPGSNIQLEELQQTLSKKQAATKSAKKRKAITKERKAEIQELIETEFVVADAPDGLADDPSASGRHKSGAKSRVFKKKWAAKEKRTLREHAINLSGGRLTDSGSFTSTPEDIERLFGEILPAQQRQAAEEGRPLRVLLWAHGGLVSETDALQQVIDYHETWLKEGIYPIYFVWETGLWRTIGNLFKGPGDAKPRDFDLLDMIGDVAEAVGDVKDAGLEKLLHKPGEALWSDMKRNAERCGQEGSGGAFAARALCEFAAAHPHEVEFYGCGHSAGSIFHAHFLPLLQAYGGVRLRELFLLAPAISSERFLDKLAPLVGPGQLVEHCSMFTMRDQLEIDDSCYKAYGKSLLYLVRNCCETVPGTPILGLQSDLLSKDAVGWGLRQFFGMESSATHPRGEVVFSTTTTSSGPNATQSTTHGGFDNDCPTLNSLVARILRDGSNKTPFKPRPTKTIFGVSRAVGATSGQGRRLALCVGINSYAQAPLDCCVADVSSWRNALGELGFTSAELLEHDATKTGILEALDEMVQSSRSGDSLVFQFSGHGAQVGDENDDERDGKDEVLVPYDYEGGNLIIDDELGEISNKLHPEASLTFFMDCCHSGTNTRKISFGMPSKFDLPPGVKGRKMRLSASVVGAFRELKGQEGSTHGYEGTKEVTFSACQDFQLAQEAGGNGFFTKAATQILVKSAGKLTHSEFLEQIIQAFPVEPAEQMPFLACSRERRGILLLGEGSGVNRNSEENSQPSPDSSNTSAGSRRGGNASTVEQILLNQTEILKRIV